MKLLDKIYNFLFEDEVVEVKEEPTYISCSDLFLKR